MVEFNPICLYCAHKRIGMTCKAFPDGIPDDVMRGGSYHLRTREGDNGITFTLADGSRRYMVEAVNLGLFPEAALPPQ